ncbi:FAD-dependent monooxygenase [Streptomyces sp. GTA36]
MTEPLDVLVVGAGPTGLALAAQLRAYGLTFRIIDRSLDLAHESRALAIQPRTLEALAGLGLADELVARGNQAVQLRMHLPRRRVLSLPLFDIGCDDTPYPFLLFLSQAETEDVLGGRQAERGTELLKLTAEGDGVVCVVRRGDGTEEEVRARYVVGCDGAHSTVRAQAGIAFEGRAYPQDVPSRRPGGRRAGGRCRARVSDGRRHAVLLPPWLAGELADAGDAPARRPGR